MVGSMPPAPSAGVSGHSEFYVFKTINSFFGVPTKHPTKHQMFPESVADLTEYSCNNGAPAPAPPPQPPPLLPVTCSNCPGVRFWAAWMMPTRGGVSFFCTFSVFCACEITSYMCTHGTRTVCLHGSHRADGQDGHALQKPALVSTKNHS